MSVFQNSLTFLSLLAMFGFLARSSMAVSRNRNFLPSEESLQARDALITHNFSLVVEANCNLVLYHDSIAVWSTHTDGKGDGCYVTLHNDGNLVLYNKLADPLWASNSRSIRSKYVLVLQKDGNAVIHGRARWVTAVSSPTEASEKGLKSMDALLDPTNILYPGETLQSGNSTNILYPGETLQSGNSLLWRANRLTMERDCSLAFYEYGSLAWNTDTKGKGIGCYLAFQTDGNVDINDHKNTRIWGTNLTLPEGNYVLIVMDYPKLGLYGPDRWSTNWEDNNGKKAMVTSQ